MSEKFRKFLAQAYTEYMRREVDRSGHAPNRSDFALYLDVPNTSLSQWMNGNREPTGENIHKLAEKLGVEVYQILGEPVAVGGNEPDLAFVVSNWRNVSETARNTIIDLVRNDLKKVMEVTV